MRRAIHRSPDLKLKNDIYEFIIAWCQTEQQKEAQSTTNQNVMINLNKYSVSSFKDLVDYGKGVFGKIKKASLGIELDAVLFEEISSSVTHSDIVTLIELKGTTTSDNVIKLIGTTIYNYKLNLVYGYPGYFPMPMWLSTTFSKGKHVTIRMCQTLLRDILSAIIALSPCNVHVPFSQWSILLGSENATNFILADVGFTSSGSSSLCIQSLLKNLLYFMTYGCGDMFPIPRQYWNYVSKGWLSLSSSEQEDMQFSDDISSYGSLVIGSQENKKIDEPEDQINTFIKHIERFDAIKMRHQIATTHQFGQLVIPFSKSVLNFIQFNVPIIERELTRKIVTENNLTIAVSDVLYDMQLQLINPVGEGLSDFSQLQQAYTFISSAVQSAKPDRITLDGKYRGLDKEDDDVVHVGGRFIFLKNSELTDSFSETKILKIENFSETQHLIDVLFSESNLHELHVSNCMGVSGLIQSQSFNCLTSLSLTHLCLDDKCGLQILDSFGKKYLPELTILDLSNNQLSEVFGVAFASDVLLSSDCLLQVVNFEFNKLKSETATALAEALKRNTSLQSLSLHRNHLTMESVDNIIKALEHRPHLSWYITEGIFKFNLKEGKEIFHSEMLG